MAQEQDRMTPIFAATMREIGQLPEVDVPGVPPEFADSLVADAFSGHHRNGAAERESGGD